MLAAESPPARGSMDWGEMVFSCFSPSVKKILVFSGLDSLTESLSLIHDSV
jgi:hypothetical protein